MLLHCNLKLNGIEEISVNCIFKYFLLGTINNYTNFQINNFQNLLLFFI